VLACLEALDIEELTVSLDGSGDSGDAVLDCALTRAGETVVALPRITIAVTPSGEAITLEELAVNVAAELPEGNWVDNEGGYGIVTYRPFEDDPGSRVDVDMTYRDEYEGDDDPDFEDEPEDYEDSVPALPDLTGAALPVVIDSVGGV
jgi:hypothetical protein